MSREEDPLPTTILIARAAGYRLALDAADVIAVRGVPQTTRLPHTPPHLLGVFHHEGRIMPLVDLLGLVGGGPATHRPRVVVIEHGASAFAVVVEQVEDVLGIPQARLQEEQGSLGRPLAGLVQGVLVLPPETHEEPGRAAQTPRTNGKAHQPTRLDALLEQAPAWLKRIHVHDDTERQEHATRQARTALGPGDVHLLDIERLWRAAALTEVAP